MKKENLEERRMEWLGRKLVPLTKERSMPMGMADTVTNAYMRKNNIFADAFNYLIYEGKPVVDSEQLRELLVKFTSSLREVMEYIKYSKDKDNLARILKDNPRMVIDREAAMVIKTITNTSIEIAEGKEEIDMCEAVEAMLSESEAKGIEKGMQQGKKRHRDWRTPDAG